MKSMLYKMNISFVLLRKLCDVSTSEVDKQFFSVQSFYTELGQAWKLSLLKVVVMELLDSLGKALIRYANNTTCDVKLQ